MIRALELRAIRHCDGGESVDRGDTQTRCAWCVGGICREAFPACEMETPQPEPRPSLIFRAVRFVLRAGN